MKTTQTPKRYFLRNLFGFPQTLYIMVSDKRWANRIYSETTSHCFNLKFCQKNKTLRYSLTNHICWQFINAIQSWYKQVSHTNIHTVQNKYLAVNRKNTNLTPCLQQLVEIIWIICNFNSSHVLMHLRLMAGKHAPVDETQQSLWKIHFRKCIPQTENQSL